MRTVVHMGDAGLRCAVFDLDSFFASVEAKHLGTGAAPLVVAAGERGAVTSANLAAKRLKIRPGDPISRLRRDHPGVTVAPARMELYRTESRHVMELLAASGLPMRQLSIDEAVLDMRPALDPVGGAWAAVRVAERLRHRVRAECGLAISVGVTRGRVSAKVAVDDAKPDGLLAVPSSEVDAWLAAKPLSVIPGIGPSSSRELARRGITTGHDALAAGEPTLVRALGRARAHWLVGVLLGTGDGVDTEWEAHSRSMGAERTLPADTDDDAALAAQLAALVADVCGRLVESQEWAQGVRVALRTADGSTLARQRRCAPQRGFPAMLELAVELLAEVRNTTRIPARLVGVTALDLTDERAETLFDLAPDDVRDDIPHAVFDGSRRGDQVGEVWRHPVFGDGLVVSRDGPVWVVSFPHRRRSIDTRHLAASPPGS